MLTSKGAKANPAIAMLTTSSDSMFPCRRITLPAASQKASPPKQGLTCTVVQYPGVRFPV